MRLSYITCCAAALAINGFASAATVPEGFTVDLVTADLNTPKGIDTLPGTMAKMVSMQNRIGVGALSKYLFVAESGSDRIVVVNPTTGETTEFGDCMGDFPVGVACYAGSLRPAVSATPDRFGRGMYVGNAGGGGVVRIGTDGIAEPFALHKYAIAGLDFGRGAYGNYLYAGEWQSGNIWRIDPQGNAEMFASIKSCQTRYLRFSHGGGFGRQLYFTDYMTGDIFEVAPDGTATYFTSTGAPCLEGLEFGPGGVFGTDLYVGDLCSGEIYRVRPDGTVKLFASGFRGVADILFMPGGDGSFTMYIVDGWNCVYAISGE